MNSRVIIAYLFLVFASCAEPTELDWQDYQTWLADHADQLIKKREINDIQVSLQYIPADFLAFKDLNNDSDRLQNQAKLDSLREFYKCGLHFQLSIEADPAKKNLLYYNIADQSDYSRRIEELSFQAENFVSLDKDGEKGRLVLSQFEGYNELRNRITLHLVFSPEWYKCQQFDQSVKNFTIIFDDPYWEMGINKFTFPTAFIKRIPTLKL